MSEPMEAESEALKIADSIAKSAKSAAGDLQKTHAHRDGTQSTVAAQRLRLQRSSWEIATQTGAPPCVRWHTRRPATEMTDPVSESGRRDGGPCDTLQWTGSTSFWKGAAGRMWMTMLTSGRSSTAGVSSRMKDWRARRLEEKPQLAGKRRQGDGKLCSPQPQKRAA